MLDKCQEPLRQNRIHLENALQRETKVNWAGRCRPHTLGKLAAKGPNDRLQSDLVNLPGRPPEPLQNKNAKTAGALPGDKGNFVVRQTWATSLPHWTKAVQSCAQTKQPKDRTPFVVDRASDAEEGQGGAQGRAVERPLRAAGTYNTRPHKTARGAPRTWRSSRPQSSGSSNATSSSTTRTLPTGA